METVKTYEEWAGTTEKTPEKVAEYAAYLKANEAAKKNWQDKFVKK